MQGHTSGTYRNYFRNLLNNLKKRDEEASPTKQHFIFMLGTGVPYISGPGKHPNSPKYYPRGNTFCFAAQMTTALLNETAIITPDPSHPYHSPSVDVINGVGLRATEAPDRIARALLMALAAIAEGKTEINISGFSRGGVESIVLAHEIQRVLDSLQEDAKSNQPKKFSDIIANSESCAGFSSTTKDELNKLIGLNTLFSDDDNALFKNKLLRNLENPDLRVNVFVNDPVPGDDYEVWGKTLYPLNWEEKKGYLYSLPPIAMRRNKNEKDKNVQFIAQHETSAGFKGITLDNVKRKEANPGIHGHGDGGQGTHSEDKVIVSGRKEDEFDLSSVQDRVLVAWLDNFFSELKNVSPIKLENEHPDLEQITNDYFAADEIARDRQLLDIYKRMQVNMPAFIELKADNYPALGRMYNERKMRQGVGQPDIDITDLNPHGDGKFVNQQHVDLWIKDKMRSLKSTTLTLPLPEQIAWLKDNFERAFDPKIKPEESDNLYASQADMTDLMDTLLKAERRGHNYVGNWLSIMVTQFAKTYVEADHTEEELKTSKQCIEDIFNILTREEKSKDKIISARAKSMNANIRKDLAREMKTHQITLISNISAQLIKSDQNVTEQERETSLIKIQQLIHDMESLNTKMIQVIKWCDVNELKKTWQPLLPGANLDTHIRIKSWMSHYFTQQNELLINHASKILKNMPVGLEQKPASLNKTFYDKIRCRANAEVNEKNAKDFKAENIELKHETQRLINKHQEAINLADQDIANKDNIISDRNSTINKQQQEIARLNAVISRQNNQINQDKSSYKQKKTISKTELQEHADMELRLILGDITHSFSDTFLPAYLQDNKNRSHGFAGIFSGHGKNGREAAHQFTERFRIKMQPDQIESISDIKILFRELTQEDNTIKQLSGGLGHTLFKSYLLAYNDCLTNIKPKDLENGVWNYMETNMALQVARYSAMDRDAIKRLYEQTFIAGHKIELGNDRNDNII